MLLTRLKEALHINKIIKVVKIMSKIEKVRLEQTLLNKQLVQAELEELREIEREIEPQISIHILNAKNLPVQLTPKISRAVQISLDNKTISTKSFTSDGSEHTAK